VARLREIGGGFHLRDTRDRFKTGADFRPFTLDTILAGPIGGYRYVSVDLSV
jgi:hypothetical protein